MNTLRPAQVCVIDDEPNEAAKIIGILNKMGLGCIHVPGDKIESLPDEPVTGLRLVFLDLHLGESEFQKTDYSKAANVFSKVVALETAPVLVAIWSKYPEEIESFRKALFTAKPDYRGRLIFLVLAKKPSDGSGGEIEEIRAAIKKLLSDAFPLDVIWAWESLAHDSATNTSAELCRLAVNRAAPSGADDQEKERQKVLSALHGILASLVKAEADKALSEHSAPGDLLRVLTSLQADRLDNSSNLATLENAKKLAQPGGMNLDETGKACLNSMLLVGPATTDGATFRPGTLFEISQPKAFESATTLSLLAMEKLLFHKEVTKKNCFSFWRWRRKCKPVLVEISPTCDFAQQKRPTARMVGGLLVPQNRCSLAKPNAPSGAIRNLELVALPGEAGFARLVLCAGFNVSMRLDSHPEFIKPVARIKEPLLSDLRSWVTSQGSRIGFTYL